jgi:hypothetical protein
MRGRRWRSARGLVHAVALRRQISDKHRQQASGVTTGARYDNNDAPTKWVVFLANSSGQPLYDVHLEAVSGYCRFS